MEYVPVSWRSLHRMIDYKAAVKQLDHSQATYLANSWRRTAANADVRHSDNPLDGYTSGQALAYAALWQSVADAIERSKA